MFFLCPISAAWRDSLRKRLRTGTCCCGVCSRCCPLPSSVSLLIILSVMSIRIIRVLRHVYVCMCTPDACMRTCARGMYVNINVCICARQCMWVCSGDYCTLFCSALLTVWGKYGSVLCYHLLSIVFIFSLFFFAFCYAWRAIVCMRACVCLSVCVSPSRDSCSNIRC